MFEEELKCYFVLDGESGELDHFRAALSISRLDAWFVDKDEKYLPAACIKQGLCRLCCLPELILRCMQVENTQN